MSHFSRILARLLFLATEVWRGRKRKGFVILITAVLALSAAADPSQFCSPTEPLVSRRVSAFLELDRPVSEGCVAAQRTDEGAAVVVLKADDVKEGNALLTVSGEHFLHKIEDRERTVLFLG